MKKKIFGAVVVVAIAVGAMINVNLNKVSNKGDLAMANMEALAQNETNWSPYQPNWSSLYGNNNNNNSNANYLSITTQKEVYVDAQRVTTTTSPSSVTTYSGEISGGYMGMGYIQGSGSAQTQQYSGGTSVVTTINIVYQTCTCCYLGGIGTCTPVNC